MSGDDEAPAFRLDLSVPNKLTDEDRERAMTWLQDLADQLAEADGKELAIQVTGVYDDEYPPDEGEEEPGDPDDSTDSPPPACSSKKAVVNIMVCPGRRPYT